MLQLVLQQYTLPTEISSGISRLQRLKYVRLGPSFQVCVREYLIEWAKQETELTLDLDSYLPLFYLPQLEYAEISLLLLNEDESGEMKFGWPGKCYSEESSLQTLLLPHSTIQSQIPHNVLEYTPNPTRLEYDLSL